MNERISIELIEELIRNDLICLWKFEESRVHQTMISLITINVETLDFFLIY